MKKLELKHLAPYLPYNLKAMVGNIPKDVLLHRNYKNNYQISFMLLLGDACKVAKPILRPLSDLTKDKLPNKKENHNVEWWKMQLKTNNILNLDYDSVTELIKNHFDVFELINNDLAIDINTITRVDG